MGITCTPQGYSKHCQVHFAVPNEFNYSSTKPGKPLGFHVIQNKSQLGENSARWFHRSDRSIYSFINLFLGVIWHCWNVSSAACAQRVDHVILTTPAIIGGSQPIVIKWVFNRQLFISNQSKVICGQRTGAGKFTTGEECRLLSLHAIKMTTMD